MLLSPEEQREVKFSAFLAGLCIVGSVVIISGVLAFPQISFGATTNFSPATSGEGYVGNNGATFSTVQSAGTGNDSNTSYAYAVIEGNRLNAGTYYIYRGFLPFDTSSIPDTDTIDSAVFHFFSDGNTPAVTTDTYCLVESTQASNTALTTSDFSAVGSTSYGSVAYAGGVVGTEYIITLNAAGLSAISKTGYTKLAIRECTHDLGNVAPTQDSYISYASQDHTTSGYRPYLAVTYSTPTSGGGGGGTASSTSSTSGGILSADYVTRWTCTYQSASTTICDATATTTSSLISSSTVLTTQDAGNVSFLLAILNTLMFLMVVGFMYNNITLKKPWR